MSYQQAPAAAGPMSALFTPGPRLGWVFRDRREFAAPYSEPQPSPQLIQAQATARMTAAEQAWQRAWKWAGKPSIILALVLVLLAGCAKSVSGSFDLGLTAVTIAVLCLPGLSYTGWRWLRREQAHDIPPEQEYQQALADWDQRAAQHQAAEQARLAGQPEWGSVTTPARRTDVFGGTLAGWQALLTVHGASILAERPLLAVDLTGQGTAAALTSAADGMRIQTVSWHLPHDLGRCGLLTELNPAQLADAIAEALHTGTPGGTRADRAVDVRVLQQLAGTLTRRGVTAQRLAAAVRAGLGHTVPDAILSPDEQEAIGGDLFPPGYRQQVAANLVRLDAVLSGLASYANDGWPTRPQRSWLTCLTMETGARSASGEVLTALIAQWLTNQVASSAENAPAVMIAGADEIARPHAERLADACERRGVPLTLMFRHLRDEATGLLGGGAAAFMRLGNHAEAEQAAAYIGRYHTFVVSSLTATRSESQTSTPQNLSQSWSQADGTRWSETETRQRVYEFAVEPTVLQNLPECALLLADRSGGALQLHAVECDPSIATLPGASTGPLPPSGGVQYGPPAVTDQPAVIDQPGAAIGPAGDYRADWDKPATEEPEPDWPGDQPPEVPWWQRNPPPGQWP
jgi:hypothetical protein